MVGYRLDPCFDLLEPKPGRGSENVYVLSWKMPPNDKCIEPAVNRKNRSSVDGDSMYKYDREYGVNDIKELKERSPRVEKNACPIGQRKTTSIAVTQTL